MPQEDFLKPRGLGIIGQHV